MGIVNFKIPDCNPLHFVKAVPSVLPQYNYKHFNDWHFPLTIRYWETPCEWWQPWQKSDHIRIQLLSEIAPIYFHIVRHNNYENSNDFDDVVLTGLMAQKSQSKFHPGLYIYEIDLDLSIFDEGIYSMVLEFGVPILARMVSNTFTIAERVENSTLTEYKHFKYFGDCFFETAFYPSIRLYGTLQYEKPGAIRTIYPNQSYDWTLLNGKPFNTWRWYTGGPEGVPDFLVPKLNQIFCMSDVKIEGIYFTAAQEGSSFEEKSEVDVPMRGWSIELRDKLNQLSRSFVADTDNPLDDPDSGDTPTPATQGLNAVIAVDTKGFVTDDNGGSIQNIQNID